MNNNNNNNMNNEEEASSSSGNNNDNNNNNNIDRKRKFDNNNNNSQQQHGHVEQQQQQQHEEISRSEMLAKFLTDEQLMDVVLQGNDGMEVHANRCVLSSRSQVFRHMLLGNFKEANQNKIKIGYEGNVLKTIVEYICTDTAKLFYLLGCTDDDDDDLLSFSTGGASIITAPSSSSSKIKRRRKRSSSSYYYSDSDDDNNNNNNNYNFKNLITTLISVADAAIYFQLPGLTKKIQKVVCDIGGCGNCGNGNNINNNDNNDDHDQQQQQQQPIIVSLMLLDSCHRSGLMNVPSKLYEIILKNVRCLPPSTNNDTTFVSNNNNRNCINCFSPDTLESILQDKYMEWEEYQLYQLVSAWVNNNNNNNNGGRRGGSTGTGTAEAGGGGGGAGSAAAVINNESSSSSDDVDEEEYKSRVQIAKTRFVQHIRFENIDPRRLTDVVSKSDFVDTNHLFDAYKKQALSATKYNPNFQNVINQPRYQPWSTVTPTITNNNNIDNVIAIKIQNSGQPSINGIYKRNGCHLGLAKFVMPTIYNGRERELWIMSSVTRTSRHWWFITLIDEEHPGTDRDIDFYRVLQDPTNPQIPPSTGWHVESEAIAPPPELLYKLKDEGSSVL